LLLSQPHPQNFPLLNFAQNHTRATNYITPLRTPFNNRPPARDQDIEQHSHPLARAPECGSLLPQLHHPSLPHRQIHRRGKRNSGIASTVALSLQQIRRTGLHRPKTPLHRTATLQHNHNNNTIIE
ncbi:MAG: hypothetical protein Q9224_007166, partial [Gallowayella concinna]